jgi:hypothetical protein
MACDVDEITVHNGGAERDGRLSVAQTDSAATFGPEVIFNYDKLDKSYSQKSNHWNPK